MQYTLANLDAVDHIVNNINAFNGQSSNIVCLTTRCRVEAALIKNDQVSFVLLELIGKDLNNPSGEVHLMSVVKVY